ncbi:hypothetical protein RhoFasSB10_03038 [Rhodococcus fascians]|uniref:hypothetical protein n=1 Tax=Rhodococcoides fascians TaxID=1828 RepID=UPI001427D986|nr:hypothetical protein [Rhodococcus fascians]
MNTPDAALTLKDWMPLIAVGVASLFVTIGWFVVHKTSRNRDLDNWRRTTLAKAFTDIAEAVGQIAARTSADQSKIIQVLVKADIDEPLQTIMRNTHLIRSTYERLEEPATKLSNCALNLNTKLNYFQSTFLAAIDDKDNEELINRVQRLNWTDILMTGKQLEGLSKGLTTESMVVIDRSAGVKPIKAMRKFTRNIGIYLLRVVVQIYRVLKRKFGRAQIEE